ncbi:MAG: hypothetical protein KKD77_24160, partial [Gammaproteobacteria bacterium]|nr:hypothetical protein [Gammaproteobacteria bacterium]
WYAHYNGTECVYAENLSGTNAVIFAGCSLNVGPAAREESHGFLMSGTGTLNGRIHHNKIHLQDSCWAGRSACCGVLVKGRVQIDSNILYEDQTFQGEGIALYGSGKQHIFGNKLYMTSHNSRGILVDGNTDSCNIHNNILYMDIEDAPPGGGESQSYGIRVRFGSDSNWIHHNTIEGTGGLANGIAIGGMEVTPRLAPKRNTIEYNNITSIYRCILIYDGTLDTTQFNNNSYTTSGSNSPVYCWVHVSELKGIEFEADTFAYASDYAVTVNTYYGHASEPIIFRNCITIDSTDITGGTNFVDYIVIEGEEPPPPPPEYFHNTANFTILDTAYSASGDTVSCIVHANTWKHDLYLQAAIDTSGEIVNVDSAVGLVPGINDTLTCNFGTRFLRIFGKTTK